MNKHTVCVLAFSALSLNLFAQKTYIHCGKLIDGISNAAQAEMTVVIDKNKIISIEKGYSKVADNDKSIDLKNKTVMPGLMDMHVHLEVEQNKNTYLQEFTMNPADYAYQSVVFSERTLMHGFTTVRDLGGSGVNVSLKKAINAGTIKGPRVYTAAKSIASTSGHADPTNGYRTDLMGNPGPEAGVANGPDECRKAVRQQIKNGADVIKITATGGVLSVARDGSSPQFTDEEIKAIVETAKDYGLKVAAHAHGAEGIKRAVRGGVASIEHGTFIDDEGITLMKEKGCYLVSTLCAGHAVTDSSGIPGFFPDIIKVKAAVIGPKIQATFAKAYKSGVKIAFGTDAGVYPHGKNNLEFLYMAEGGMPAMDIIKAATINAADLLGVKEKLGSIEKDKLADIVAVDGDPLIDIKVMQNVSFVMKDGMVYKN